LAPSAWRCCCGPGRRHSARRSDGRNSWDHDDGHLSDGNFADDNHHHNDDQHNANFNLINNHDRLHDHNNGNHRACHHDNHEHVAATSREVAAEASPADTRGPEANCRDIALWEALG
jgi:hypothetical protein